MKGFDSRVEEFDCRVEEFESSGGIRGRGVKEYSRRVDEFALLGHRRLPIVRHLYTYTQLVRIHGSRRNR